MWLTWADRFIFSIYWFTNSFHFHFFNPKLANQTTFPTKARPPPSLLRKKRFKKLSWPGGPGWSKIDIISDIKSFQIFVKPESSLFYSQLGKGSFGRVFIRGSPGREVISALLFLTIDPQKLKFFQILFLYLRKAMNSYFGHIVAIWGHFSNNP